MLQSIRRHWFLSGAIALILVAGIVVVTLVMRRMPRGIAHAEPDLPSKPQAPPDLQRLRDAYAAGTVALQRDDGADAVKHLSSFDFGPRPVEEYRLYYLANGQQLAGDTDAARLTLAKLWRRKPRMAFAKDAAFNLGSLYDAECDFARSSETYTVLARSADTPAVAGAARWRAAGARIRAGDPAGALYSARTILIESPSAPEAKDAETLVRAMTGVAAPNPLPLTPSERLDRGIALIAGGDAQRALDELTTLEKAAPSQLRTSIQLQRGIALHALRRYEDSIEVLEPLTSGPYKYAIPALRTAAKNYAIVAASINPEVIKTVKERKRVGTVKVRVGKGKKRRTVNRPKYQTVFRKVTLIDLPKKKKKDEYERLASERLKDLLTLPLDDGLRLETLNKLAERALAKNQTEYLQELVPQIIQLDRQADPALQYLWDKGWAAYTRGDLGTARKLFRFITDTYTHPNVRRQAEYWYARAADRHGEKEEARAIYQKLASAPYSDLYAQHAVSRGAKRVENDANPLERDGPDWQEIAEKQMPAELQIAYELTALSSMRDAFNEIRRNMKRENMKYAHALLADIHHAAGNEVLMYGSLRKAWPQLATVEQDSVPLYFFRMYYPVKYGEEIEEYSKKMNLDPALVRGLILQESYYNPEARSRVGATGLMQLMPPTAKEHARRLKIPFAASRLENPEVNVRLGTYHLRMLINLFRGNTYLAIAAYNAGQGNVGKWKRAAPGKPTDELLESIPFQETRNYVKRVTILRSTYSRLAS